jgi:hypothetical protein
MTLLAAPVYAEILVFSPNGVYTKPPVQTLAAVLANPNTSGKTIVITSALNIAMSNISSPTVHAWPTDRTLKVEKGGSINPTTKFTGLKEVTPEMFGATGGADDTSAVNKAIACIMGNSAGGKLVLTKVYNVTSVNLSSQVADYVRHIVIEGIGTNVSGFNGTSSTSIVVDTIGSNCIIMRNFSIGGVGTVGLLRARSTVSHTSSMHETHRVWVIGNFSISSVAFLSSESNSDYDPYWKNNNGSGNTFFTSTALSVGETDNLFGITSTNGTIWNSSNTDNRVYGGIIQHWVNGAVVARFVNAANYTFYSTDIGTGEAVGGVFAQYELTPSFGNAWNGNVTWNDTLFEGGGPPGATPSSAVIHYLKGNPNVPSAFYNISSRGGYYNIYPSGVQNIIGYNSGGTTYAGLVMSDFTKARFNNSAIPTITLYIADNSDLDLSSIGMTSVMNFTGYMGAGKYVAGTVNSAQNVLGRVETYEASIPTTGLRAKGSIAWNTTAATMYADGLVGWLCSVSGTPGVWNPMYTGGVSVGSTASRQTVHTGYMYYDTTLGLPIWWDGTNWRDAAGGVR